MSVHSAPAATHVATRRLRAAWRERPARPLWFQSRAAALTAVALITLLAIPLHISELRFHFWVDEGISVGIASHPLAQLPALLRQDGSPPLYYALLHLWMALFGRSEVDTHLLSVLFALLAVPAAYWAAAGIAGRRTGLYAAGLTAGLPFLVAYAQETRMYSLVLLLSLLVAGTFARAFVLGRRRWMPGFAVALAADLYTHNWALFLALAAVVAFAFCLWRRPVAQRRALARDGTLTFAGTAVLFAPWLPTLVYQATHTGAPWAQAPTLWSLTQGGYFVTGTRGAAVALLLVAGHGLLAGDRRPRGSALTAAAGLAVLGFGTVLIAWLYAKHTPAWAMRYLAAPVGPLILLFAIGLRRAGRFGLIGALLVCAFWVLDPLPTSLNTKSNVATVAAAVRPQLNAGSLVLSTQPEQVPVIHYYLPAVRDFLTPIGVIPDPGILDWRNALDRFRASSVASVLAPALAHLHAGERIALIIPDQFARQPEWARLIAVSSRRWQHYLGSDPALRLILRTSASTALPETAAVHVRLYAVR